MKKKQGHDQTPRSRLAAERNWMLFRLASVKGLVAHMAITGWIHPACANVIQRQLKRAKSNIDVSWKYRQAKLPARPAHKHIVEEVTG